MSEVRGRSVVFISGADEARRRITFIRRITFMREGVHGRFFFLGLPSYQALDVASYLLVHEGDSWWGFFPCVIIWGQALVEARRRIIFTRD